MFKLINIPIFRTYLRNSNNIQIFTRHILSPAYHCNELWDNRLKQPLFQKINLDEFYHELDQKYQKTKSISFIDVDVFVNAIQNDLFDDEMLDLVYKLRMTPETTDSLPSMSYAVVKNLLRSNKIQELHTVLEDRLNYGIFLDYHMTNILLDYFWKKKDFISGARIASHSMLQEDPEHAITYNLSLLHCYNCLLSKGEWHQPPGPEEPEEEVKIRVKYIRNEYDDQHFDLKDCKKLIGKTLMYLTKGKSDELSNSFFILGASLFGAIHKANEKLSSSQKSNLTLFREIFDLIPEDNEMKSKVENIKLNSEDVNSILQSEVDKVIQKCSEMDIATQCEVFKEWEQKRLDCLLEKEDKLSKIERMKKIELLQKELKEKETKLWFFENEEKIELEIEEKEELKTNESKSSFKGKMEEVNDEEYIPPTIRK